MQLYHVTTFSSAQQISEVGLRPGTDSVKKLSPTGIVDDVTESPNETIAREKLNAVLPGHGLSSFFWADENQAERIKEQMEEKDTLNPYVIIEVESEGLHCKVGDHRISDRIFKNFLVHPNIFDAEPKNDGESWLFKAQDDLIARYLNSIRRLGNMEGDENVEVMCIDYIPPSHIIRIDGLPRDEWWSRYALLPMSQTVLPIATNPIGTTVDGRTVYKRNNRYYVKKNPDYNLLRMNKLANKFLQDYSYAKIRTDFSTGDVYVNGILSCNVSQFHDEECLKMMKKTLEASTWF